MPTTPIHTFANLRVAPLIDPEDASEIAVNLSASTTYQAGTILGELIGTDEISTITIDAAGGTFTITKDGQTTVALAWNATAAVVQAALEALSTVGIGNVKVTLAGLVYTITWRWALGSSNQAAPTTTATGLTGGAGTAAVATATAGVAGTPGVYAPYVAGNTNGSQLPKGVLRYACVTDSAGLISYGLSGSSEHGEKVKSTSMFIKGTFRSEDLYGLDTAGLALLGRLVYGTIAHGAVALYGS